MGFSEYDLRPPADSFQVFGEATAFADRTKGAEAEKISRARIAGISSAKLDRGVICLYRAGLGRAGISGACGIERALSRSGSGNL